MRTPALALGPSESMAPTLGWPFFLDRSRAGEVEKRAEREGRIEEFWRKEEGEKLGTKLLEMEAKRPAICNYNWHLTKNCKMPEDWPCTSINI